MQLSHKQKKFSKYFAAFLKSTLNLKKIGKKRSHSKITESENVVS